MYVHGVTACILLCMIIIAVCAYNCVKQCTVVTTWPEEPECCPHNEEDQVMSYVSVSVIATKKTYSRFVTTCNACGEDIHKSGWALSHQYKLPMYKPEPVKKQSTVINTQPCTCCGQERPYPMEPGIWQYRQACLDTDWNTVEIKVVYVEAEKREILHIFPEGEAEPIWWPTNVQWRKLQK